MSEQVRITEIYHSIQGESSYAGLPCTFIRLTGCPLDCKWCDTVYAFEKGEYQEIDSILGEVERLGGKNPAPLVEVTGGEPLAQENCIPLMQALVDKGCQVLLETSGAFDISSVPAQVHVIMDLKAPGSGMCDKNMWENLQHLKKTDEIKCVLKDREDYEWARDLIWTKKIHEKSSILFSCAFGLLAPKQLTEWILEDHLPVRFQLQMHKYIWHPRAKGV